MFTKTILQLYGSYKKFFFPDKSTNLTSPWLDWLNSEKGKLYQKKVAKEIIKYFKYQRPEKLLDKSDKHQSQ